MGFEKFTKTGRGFRPKVSIWSRGQIGFNQGAIRHLGLEEFGFIVLYYDADSKRIGIELTNDENAEGANKIKKRQTGASVGAKAFLDYYQIDYTKTKGYDLTPDPTRRNFYIIELAQEEEQKEDRLGA